MKRLLRDKYKSFNHAVLSYFFYQWLQPNLQQNLFSTKGRVLQDDLAKLADNFITTNPTVQQMTVSNVIDSFETQQLTALISQLTL